MPAPPTAVPATPTRPTTTAGDGFLADWIDPATGGIRLGTFRLFPTLDLTGMFDDNVFATSNDKKSDYVGIVSPGLTLRSAWKEHELNLWSSAEIGRYARFKRENYEDYQLGFDGRYDFARDFYAFGGLEFDRTHEARESPDGVFGLRPTIYRDLDGHAGLHKEFGPFTIRFGGTIRWLDYDDVAGTSSIINNDDRDRVMYTIAARVSYKFARGYELFGQATYDRRDYAAYADDNGYRRNSHGYRMAVGLKAELGRQLDAEVYAGYLEQIYDDVRFRPVSNIHFGARLRWLVKPSILITGFVDRSIEETTLAGASSYISTRFGLRFEHALAEKWTLLAHTSYSANQYQDIARTDDIYSAGIGLRYYIDRRLWLGLDYSYQYRDSTADLQQYTQNLVMLRVGTELAPPPRRRAITPAASAATPTTSAAVFDGFYVGTQFGFGDHITELHGPRESDGTLNARFGKYGWAWGGVAGWGKTIDVVYLGLEVEGEYADSHWQHARLPGGRIFAVDQKYSFGASLRAGYVTPFQALLYVRLGFVRTGFNTQYQHQRQTVDQDNELTGLRFGAGIEHPLTQALFLRSEYVYTNYPSYTVTVRPGTDTFEPSGSLFRLALVWRFNGGDAFSAMSLGRETVNFGGFYAGGTLGHNGVGSRVTGPRENASVLDADFRGQGFGLAGFGGYGFVYRSFYVGAESELEGSWSGWDHRRAPHGSDFTQDKVFSLGGAARLGYVVAGRALIYGRIGAVLTQFRTTFQDGPHSYSQNDNRVGLRFGVGVEVPVTKSIFTRLDYSHTLYGSYTLSHVSGVEVYKPNENLVRLGVVYRF